MGKVIMSGIVPAVTPPSVDIVASSLAIGEVVKLMENGVAVDYLVVHQGLPSDAYDSSCNGTWLLRKNLYGNDVRNTISWQYPYDSEEAYSWGTCSANTWLNSTYYNLLGSIEQTVIKEVNILTSETTTVVDKVFWLSGTEVGFVDNSDFTSVGAKLDYFDENSQNNADLKRVATLGGTAYEWWLRSQRRLFAIQAFYIKTDGSGTYTRLDNSKGNRPALIIPSTSTFDKNTKILKS